MSFQEKIGTTFTVGYVELGEAGEFSYFEEISDYYRLKEGPFEPENFGFLRRGPIAEALDAERIIFGDHDIRKTSFVVSRRGRDFLEAHAGATKLRFDPLTLIRFQYAEGTSEDEIIMPFGGDEDYIKRIDTLKHDYSIVTLPDMRMEDIDLEHSVLRKPLPIDVLNQVKSCTTFHEADLKVTEAFFEDRTDTTIFRLEEMAFRRSYNVWRLGYDFYATVEFLKAWEAAGLTGLSYNTRTQINERIVRWPI